MPPAGFEASIPASERPQTHALDRAATWIGDNLISPSYIESNGKLDTSPPYLANDM